jgi:hypothetical protein
MTKSQINNRIAKICGWQPIQTWYISIDGGETALMYFDTQEQAFEKLRLAVPCEEHEDCCQPEVWCEQTPVPNYCECLNSMYQAECCLTEEQWVDYIDFMPRTWERAVHSTALVRAEAFLKTFNKWGSGR